MTESYPDENELQAYVDQEMPLPRIIEIDRLRKTDAELDNKIQELLNIKFLVREAYAEDADPGTQSIASEAVIPSSAAINSDTTVSARQSVNRHWQWFGMCATLLLGVWGGYVINKSYSTPPDTQNWIAQIANYQSMYTEATLSTPASPIKDIESEQLRLGNALDISLTIPDLRQFGLEFKRGQILKSHDSPLIQLAYLHTETGQPFALCILRADSSDKFNSGNQNGVNYGVWQEGEHSLIIIGEFAPGKLRDAYGELHKVGIVS